MAPTVGRERGGGEKELWIMARTWTNWNLVSEPLGTGWPYGAIGEMSSGKRKPSKGKEGEMKLGRDLRKGTVTHR
jgi:hypothetical protein